MTIALSVLAGILLLIGFVGCVVPVLPGPIIAYCGLLTLILTEKCPSTLTLVTMGLVVAAVTVADYVVPAIGARKFDCSRWGTFGCFVGTIAGLFFVPLGILLGPFLGAFLGELIARKPVGAARTRRVPRLSLRRLPEAPRLRRDVRRLRAGAKVRTA